MCGITGFLGIDDDVLLRKMTRIISYRGPDDEGIFSEGKVGLGHRRLSVIDLSNRGHQPMMDTKSKAIIVYNGEIYNFNEIRKQLIDIGYSFRSNTDSEVVLNSYLAWGEDCLSRFNGMFAFAIWDRKNKTLFLARDRIGIKPLYYTRKGSVFLFGSGVKSILCWDKIPREVNARALDYYFTFRYNHLDETLFKDILKVPAGHWMKVRLNKSKRLSFNLCQYWDVSVNSSSSGRKSVEGMLADQIKRSVDYRMISDVPLGVFLSSGVDSSSIVGIMKKELGKTANTFTVGFDYPGFEDELNPVRFTTNYFKTDHTEYICKPNMISIIPKVIWNTDELNADPALIPTYLISKIASEKVKVVLAGEGADELFGGYERTMFMKYVWSLSQLSPAIAKMVPSLIGLVPSSVLDKMFKYSSSLGSRGVDRLLSFCRNIQNIGESYLDVAAVFNHNEKKQLYGSKMQNQLREENIADTINKEFFRSKIKNSGELFNRLSYFELKTRLPNDLLAKVDTMTMAHSVEGRVPFLDHKLVELAFSIPPDLKIKYAREKYVLRKAVLRYLPREIARRKKDHFFVPIHLWLQNELRATVERILTRDNIEKSGYLNSDFLLDAYRNYKQGKLFYARQIWNVLFFLIWHKLYIETDEFLSVDTVPISLENLFSSR
ncbi:MAG: asparagine synthase (glutamine-hydrolyzing) [Candidatus Auribacterota bacterium]|nr:asparagine synthase (glutamine-hydrolyzing) [Candidatus Auribacterota bacterium]